MFVHGTHNRTAASACPPPPALHRVAKLSFVNAVMVGVGRRVLPAGFPSQSDPDDRPKGCRREVEERWWGSGTWSVNGREAVGLGRPFVTQAGTHAHAHATHTYTHALDARTHTHAHTHTHTHAHARTPRLHAHYYNTPTYTHMAMDHGVITISVLRFS
jgi:hypothetical protein